MSQQFNAEFPIEMRRHDPSVTVVDIMVNHRHNGGWGGVIPRRPMAYFPMPV